MLYTGASRLRVLLETALEAVTDGPERIQIATAEDGRHVTFTVLVPQTEMGKVIGKQGRMARTLRTLMGAAAMKHQRTCSLDIRVFEEQMVAA